MLVFVSAFWFLLFSSAAKLGSVSQEVLNFFLQVRLGLLTPIFITFNGVHVAIFAKDVLKFSGQVDSFDLVLDFDTGVGSDSLVQVDCGGDQLEGCVLIDFGLFVVFQTQGVNLPPVVVNLLESEQTPCVEVPESVVDLFLAFLLVGEVVTDGPQANPASVVVLSHCYFEQLA